MGGQTGWADLKLLLIIALIGTALVLAGCVESTEQPGTNDGTTPDSGTNDGGNGDGSNGENAVNNTSEPTPPGDELDTYRLERLIHDFVNENRIENNIRELTHSQSLRVAAREYSETMNNMQLGENESYQVASVQNRLDRYEKHNAFQCERTTGNGTENIVVTKYGQAVQQADGDRVVYSSLDRLAQGIIQNILNNESKRSNMMNPAYRYHGAGVSYNRSTSTVYVTQSFC